MPAYGSLWPYAIALPLGALGGTYAAFTALMATLTGVALLAVYAILRRVCGNPVAALALYLPCLATSFFLERGTSLSRYSPGDYFGMFPLRYAGAYLLALLSLLTVDPRRARRLPLPALFAFAGLVVVNNLDFGLAALGATVVALLVARPPEEPLRRLGAAAAAGLAAALALVCLLTLLRTGSLPRFELLTRYGRIFVNGGYGNHPLPALGFHVLVTATFAAAVVTAAVRRAAGERDVVLTAMLAWTGVFGLGSSIYFYAYRSHPDVLINLFSSWSVTVALLLVVVLRGMWADRRPAIAGVLVLFAFGLVVCSVAQLPLPWQHVRRIAASSAYEPFRLPALARAIAQVTRPGERVVVLAPVGHRVAHDAGVVNVNPYTGMGQMPSREQLFELLARLRSEGGTSVFVAEAPTKGLPLQRVLARHGLRPTRLWPQPIGWNGASVTRYEYVAGDP
jgi:hypothetical protein